MDVTRSFVRDLELKAFSCGVGHGLNLVAVGIANECAVVVRVIVGTNTRRSFIDPAVRQRCLIKAAHRFPIGSLKGDVNAIA